MAIGGSGTQADPWTIGTPQDLVAFSADTSYWASGAYAVLTADIDMDGVSGFSPIGNSTTQYQGNFDGQGHVISNLTITRSGVQYVGMFGYAGGGLVENIGCTGFDINGGSTVGGLVGIAWNGHVDNCYINNSTVGASGNSVGGLCAAVVGGGTVSNCYSYNMTLSGNTGIGGVVGVIMNGGIASNCATYGGTHGDSAIGVNSRGTVTNCYSSASTGVTSEVFHSQGFWDGTGVSGTTYLSWDFPPWCWDSTDNLPVLQPTTPPIVADLDFSQVAFMTIHPILPNEYTQLEYITANGTQYINTGIKTQDNLRLGAKFQMGREQKILFGGRSSTGGGNGITWGFVTNPSAGNYAVYNMYGSTNSPTAITQNVLDNQPHELDYSAGIYTIDGITQPNRSMVGNITESIDIYFGTWNNAGTADERGLVGRIYWFRITNATTGAPLLSLVPAKRNSDNEIGVYDLVSDTFFTNAGTGTFTAGADVTSNPVDSISIGGTQVWQRGRLYQMQIGTGSAYTNPASISWSGDAQPLSKAERTALLRQHCRHAVVNYENGQPTIKYWLYKDDLNYKATDSTCSTSSGEASDLTGTDGDVMLLYDPVWWTVSKANNVMTITFSWDGKFDENAVSPHLYGTSSADATMMSYVGLGVFEATVSNNQLRSVNVASAPQVSKTEEQFHTLAITSRSNHYNNMLPMTLAWYDITLMFESGSRNTQASFGNGFVSMSSASAVNTDWSASSAWDSATVYTDGTHGVTACGIQNGWGNVWKFIGETIKSNTNIKFSVLGGGDHYNIESGYAGAPASWRTVSGLSSSSNYVWDMGGDSCMPFLATTVGASATTGWADYFYTNANENCCALFGGRWNNDAAAGACDVGVNNVAYYSTGSIGARLQVMIP